MLLLSSDDQPELAKYPEVVKSDNEKILKKYSVFLSDLLSKAKSDISKMESNLLEFAKYTGDVFSVEEGKYLDAMRKKEIERKIIENTGSISNIKTGRKVTVIRDIIDIERAQELTAKDKIIVLDFSKKKVSETVDGVKKNNVVRRAK